LFPSLVEQLHEYLVEVIGCLHTELQVSLHIDEAHFFQFLQYIDSLWIAVLLAQSQQFFGVFFFLRLSLLGLYMLLDQLGLLLLS